MSKDASRDVQVLRHQGIHRWVGVECGIERGPVHVISSCTNRSLRGEVLKSLLTCRSAECSILASSPTNPPLRVREYLASGLCASFCRVFRYGLGQSAGSGGSALR